MKATKAAKQYGRERYKIFSKKNSLSIEKNIIE